MCANFQPPPPETLIAMGLGIALDSYRSDVYPQQSAPVVTSENPEQAVLGSFGLVPQWAENRHARFTYNARTETVATKPSFRDAWQQGRLAIVPMLAFYEPCYESGRAVRHRISRVDGAPFWVAAIWEPARAETVSPDDVAASFSLLTINADGHPLMGRMHGPEDEKRSVVVLPDSEALAWLEAFEPQQRDAFLRPFDATTFRSVPAETTRRPAEIQQPLF